MSTEVPDHQPRTGFAFATAGQQATTKSRSSRSFTDPAVAGGRATEIAGPHRCRHGSQEQSATGLPGWDRNSALLPTAVVTPTVGFARLSPGVDFGAPDGPADLVFLIAAPMGPERST